jgi:hypothetical protein
MSTLRVNTLQNTSGVEVYTAKAWVNFNGTGTVAIRASGNVSSITDRGTGQYTVNFTTAMPDANYAVNATLGGGNAYIGTAVSFSTSSVQMNGWTDASGFFDSTDYCVSVFR